MSVQFNEEDMVTTRPKPQKLSLFTRVVYKLKLADNEAGAQRVMLIIAGVCIAAALFFFLRGAGVI